MSLAVEERGGAFLLRSPDPAAVVTPEDLTPEQRMIGETVRRYAAEEVQPRIPELERHDYDLMRRLLRRAGELGFLAAEIPEAYGGLGLDKVTTTVILESLAPAGGFTVTYGAHTGIGSQPIVYFGNAEQKRRYLPKLATGEMVAAYALTEAGSGSDALGARTVARLSPDGRHYILSGVKQWITNAGFADLFVVYAKVDGEKFTAFIVERSFPGVRTGPEEKKMGIRASSTCELILEDVPVPVENVLHEVGKGHQVAFNILNIGRWKLAAGCVGGAKDLIAIAARYARERQQFGRPIASFRMIQQKLAAMAVRTYALESMIYRVAGLMDAALARVDLTRDDAGQRSAQAIAEYALECSASKVFGSECLDFVVDEAVQIHGGYGYMQEYAVETAYRDSRINRIFEGTNEINRLLIPATLMRKALRNELPFMQAAADLQQELMTLVPPTAFGDDPLGQEKWLVAAARKVFLMVAGLAVQKHMQALEEEQELLAAIADMAIEILAMDSALLRAEKALRTQGPEAAAAKVDLSRLYVHEAFPRIEGWARTALAAMAEGDALRQHLMVLRKLTRFEPVNTVALGRRIAARVLEAGGYVT